MSAESPLLLTSDEQKESGQPCTFSPCFRISITLRLLGYDVLAPYAVTMTENHSAFRCSRQSSRLGYPRREDGDQ
jgi:hypothetical protein